MPFAAEQQQLTRVELHNDTTRGPQIRPFVPTWAEGSHPESIFSLKKIDLRHFKTMMLMYEGIPQTKIAVGEVVLLLRLGTPNSHP